MAFPDLLPLDDCMTHIPPPAAPQYRGSQKHKNRPTGERKGTRCPEWTHSTAVTGYGSDPFAHDWEATTAHRLFEAAVHSRDGKRRYATEGGVAFEAKATNDGSWHGYPVPWEAIPADIVCQWVEDKLITRREIKKFWSKDKDDLNWAIEADIQ